MNTAEPNATALLLTTCGLLLAVSVVFSRASQRAGVPIALLFLLIGIVAGSEGLGGIAFEDYRFAFRLGAIALALILFDGGLSTPVGAVRKVWAPAGLLATLGVVLVSGLVAAVRPASRPRLEGGAPDRRGGVLHRRGRGIRRAAGERSPPQATGRTHARGRVGRQRPDGRHPDHHAHPEPAPPRAPVAARHHGRDRAAPGGGRRGRAGHRVRWAPPPCAASTSPAAGSTRRSPSPSPSSPSAWRRWLWGAGSSRSMSRDWCWATDRFPSAPASSGCTTPWPGWVRSGCS